MYSVTLYIYLSQSKQKNVKMEEVWIEMVEEHKGFMISNLGNVKSLARIAKRKTFDGIDNSFPVKEKILKPSLEHIGYSRVHLNKKVWRIHSLVVTYFIRPLMKGECVNHKNGIKTDNRLENLEIVTYRENNIHSIKTGLKDTSVKKIRVVQVTKEGEFVREYESLTRVADYKFNRKMVKRVLNNTSLENNGFLFYTKEEWLKLQ